MRLFKRSRGRSFGGIIQRYVLGTLAFILLIYTLIIHIYVDQGTMLVAQFEMETRVSRFETAREADPDVAPPDGYNIKSYWRYEDLPPAIRQIVPAEEIELGEILDVDLYEDSLEISLEGEEIEVSLIVSEEDETATDEFGNDFYLIFPKQLRTGEILYVVQSFSEEDWGDELVDRFDFMSQMTLAFALFIFLFVAVIMWFLGRRLTRPSEGLADWAQRINSENASDPIPDFHFRELNLVAERLQGSIQRINRFVEREREFLGQASHELRTPVTVIRGNVELLNKLQHNDMETGVIRRIERANKSMQQLIETLLWLSRESEGTLEAGDHDYVQIVQNAVSDLMYLADGKKLDVRVDLPEEPLTLQTFATPLYIVAVNLIRNAFQHTPQGTVSVALRDGALHVDNVIEGEDKPKKAYQHEGIGLHLVRQVCTRCGWRIEIEPHPSGGMSACLRVAGQPWGKG